MTCQRLAQSATPQEPQNSTIFSIGSAIVVVAMSVLPPLMRFIPPSFLETDWQCAKTLEHCCLQE